MCGMFRQGNLRTDFFYAHPKQNVMCSMQEKQIENLLLAKDFSDCVVYIGNGAVTVAVPAPIDGLSEEAVARITDIICTETEYDATQLNIIEVKA